LSDERLRVAVVGLGKMGLLHSSILNVLPNVELAAVCEKSSLTRKIAKKVMHNVSIVEDTSDFAGLDLDAVYVTTPISSHYIVAKVVYEQNLARNLFVEKPLSASYSQSKELLELSNNVKSVNMVGYLRRFYVTFKMAKDLLDKNSIGSPQSFMVSAFSADFSNVKSPDESIARGGVLRDLGSYALDLALWFFGDLSITSAKREALTGPNAEDEVHFTSNQMQGNLQGAFSVSWCKDGYRMPEVNLSIKGPKGTIEVNDDQVSLNLDGDRKVWFRHNLNDNVGFWLGNPEYYREDAVFIKAIKERTVVEPNFTTAAKVDQLIENIQRMA
jgi:predicted dehydrogenase